MEIIQLEALDSNSNSPVKLNPSEDRLKVKTVQELSSDTTTESPNSKRSPRPNFNIGGLSVRTRAPARGLLNLQQAGPIREPNSAIQFTTNKKNRQRTTKQHDYLTCYENADAFLDEKEFAIVEPGEEIKVKKYVKVIPRSLSVDRDPVASPLYCGSPTLAKIGASSLLARRTNSRNQSPQSTSGEKSDDSGNQQQVGVTKKVSKFSLNVTSRTEKETGFEEEKMQSRIKFLTQELGKLHFTNLDESPQRDRNKIRTIQEMSNEATPIGAATNLLSFANVSPRKSPTKIDSPC